MRKIILFSFLLLATDCWSQDISGFKPIKIFNSSFKKETYYIQSVKDSNNVKGLVVMLPGLYDSPLSPLVEAKFTKRLFESGYVLMVPVLSDDNMFFALNESDYLNLNKMIEHLISKWNLNRDVPIFLGGISLGGTIALKFFAANQRHIFGKSFSISNVFAVDPPLDLVRFRNTLKKLNERETLKLMDSCLSIGDQDKLISLSVYNPEEKIELSSFNFTKLKIYCEPDLDWYLKTKHLSLYELNILDCSGYITELLKTKSNKVELVLTHNKGFRQGPNGIEKNPHSWSIIDPDSFNEWILSVPNH